jgi:hypothetical protein
MSATDSFFLSAMPALPESCRGHAVHVSEDAESPAAAAMGPHCDFFHNVSLST